MRRKIPQPIDTGRVADERRCRRTGQTASTVIISCFLINFNMEQKAASKVPQDDGNRRVSIYYDFFEKKNTTVCRILLMILRSRRIRFRCCGISQRYSEFHLWFFIVRKRFSSISFRSNWDWNFQTGKY